MDYNVKRLSDYSDESLLSELRRVAKKIGKDTMTRKEFKAAGGRISESPIIRIFGSWNTALDKAGISKSRIRNICDEDLFAEMGKLWDSLGRQPTAKEMRRLGRFSEAPYKRRFGTWMRALEAFVRWKNTGRFPRRSSRTKKAEYGELIDFLGLRHAPINKKGVIYLFGMLSKQLGFIIEAVRTDFPDCEGKRRIPGKRGKWERVAIEFEYKSSDFKEHRHKPNECDVIVCWENNWRGCPIEVISLKKLMSKNKEWKE